jgi:hypothetical protein
MGLRLFLLVKESLPQPLLRLDVLPSYKLVHLDLTINNTLSEGRPDGWNKRGDD